MTEANLQRYVAQYLNNMEQTFKNFTWFYCPSNMHTTKIQASIHKGFGARAGIPDCIILGPDGKTIFIELKFNAGVLSKPQKDFHEKLKSLSHPAYIVRAVLPHNAVNQVEKILQAEGVI